MQDKAEEEAQRADGFTDWHTDHKGMEGKADAPAAPAAPAVPVATDPPAPQASVVPPPEGGEAQPELSRDELKAKAEQLGITFPRNITTEKLAELVAGA